MRNIVEKIKTHISRSVTFVLKIVPFLYNVEKYDGVRQDKEDNTKWHMRLTRWWSETTDTRYISNTTCLYT